MALIVAEPGPLRDSLQVFLRTLPQIEAVDLADDAPSTLAAVMERDPALILLDANLPDGEALVVLRALKTGKSRGRCLVLADDRQQQQAATETGADAVLIKGTPAADLFTTIEGLLPYATKKRLRRL